MCNGASCSKKNNIGPVVFVSEKIKERAFKEKQIANRFAEALEKKQFVVYYQPKVSLTDYSLVGAEALVRWKTETEMISPIEFIPVYEQNGMICDLDFYMLRQVCADIVEWKRNRMEPVRVSVNFSRKHLVNPNLADDIDQILDQYGVDRKWIEIELTETVDEKESRGLIEFVQQMKQRNVAISIDDFGTGYSSLNHLQSIN